MVIGNPPWTRLREAERHSPDKNPDLPFLWRATEWAKPDDGIIAFALPARIFGRTSGKGQEAWRAILRSISITGPINGADLRKTAVWESIDVPFRLLFTRNAVTSDGHRFYYASPLYEPLQNRRARFRLDYEATQPVSIERVEKQPWILKTLSLGTWCDVELIESLMVAFPQDLKGIWKDWNPKNDKTGQGFNLSLGLEQKPANFMDNLLVFESPQDGFSIQYDQLETFLERYGDVVDEDIRSRSLASDPGEGTPM